MWEPGSEIGLLIGACESVNPHILGIYRGLGLLIRFLDYSTGSIRVRHRHFWVSAGRLGLRTQGLRPGAWGS